MKRRRKRAREHDPLTPPLRERKTAEQVRGWLDYCAQAIDAQPPTEAQMRDAATAIWHMDPGPIAGLRSTLPRRRIR